MFDGPGWGFGIGAALSGILGTLFSLLVLVVAVALIFLLVRFLLIATKAAQLYIAQHERQARPSAAVAADEPARTQPLPPTKPGRTSQAKSPS